MNIDLKSILYILLILVIQTILDNYVDLGLHLHIVILPIIILLLPYRYKTLHTMILAFVLGLAVDIFTTGILGLYAGALTAVAFVRQKILHSMLDDRNMERHDRPDYKVFGFGKGIFYTMFHYLTFFVVYTLLDNMGIHPIGQSLIKVLFSTLTSGLIALWLFKMFKKH